APLGKALLQRDEERFVGEALDFQVGDEGQEIAEDQDKLLPALLVLEEVPEDDGEVAAVRLQISLAGDGCGLLGKLGVEVEDREVIGPALISDEGLAWKNPEARSFGYRFQLQL